jgi:hypothetical protein
MAIVKPYQLTPREFHRPPLEQAAHRSVGASDLKKKNDANSRGVFMAHYGQLRDYRFAGDVDDVRGASLYGSDDEKLGTIHDVIFDHASGKILYAVVDTGAMSLSELVIVPAAEIHPSQKHPNDFAINAGSSRISSLPRYNEDTLRTDADWNTYRKNYDEAWGSGPVLNKEMSTHMITPEPSEMPPAKGSGADDEAYTPDRIVGKFPPASEDSNKLRLRPSGLAAKAEDGSVPGVFVTEEKPTLAEEEAEDRAVNDPVEAQRDHLTDPEGLYVSEGQRHARWSAFEDHLRRNRVDITASCRSCVTAKDDKVA